MHLHALNGSLGAVVILVHIGSHLGSIGGGLLAIIERLQHPCVGTSFWQQKVVLENSVILSRGLIVELSWSIILKVLHEPGLCLVHNIIVMWCALLRGIVKPGCCSIGARTES
jgi:hypothetical protein